jgi:hypothetical protein
MVCVWIGKGSMSMGVWQGVAMDSLKFHLGPPCPTSLCPEMALWLFWGWPAHRVDWLRQSPTTMYPLGHPTPYAYGRGVCLKAEDATAASGIGVFSRRSMGCSRVGVDASLVVGCLCQFYASPPSRVVWSLSVFRHPVDEAASRRLLSPCLPTSHHLPYGSRLGNETLTLSSPTRH